MADDEKPPFDPSQPFTAAPSAVAEKPPFDPSKPFEAVGAGVQDTGKSSTAMNLLSKTAEPVTSYWPTYQEMNREAREQMARGAGQVLSPSAEEAAAGVGNIALGGLSYVGSPVNAAMRTFASRPLEETTGIPKEYTEFALSLLPWMPKGAGIGRTAAAVESVPSAEKLKTVAGAGFDAARDASVAVPASDVADLATKIEQKIFKAGARPYNEPRTFGWLEEAKNAPEGAIADAGDLHGMRKAISKAANYEGYHAQTVKRELDKYIQQQIPELKTAIANWAAYERSAEVTGKVEAAENQAGSIHSGLNLGNKIRQKFRSLVDPEHPERLQGYTPEEIDAMKQIARGTFTQNAIRIASNILGGGGGLGSLIAAGFGHAAEGMAGAVAFPAMGMGLRQLGATLTARKVNQLDEMIRARSPLGASMAATQAERQAAGQWAQDYINANAHPSMGNLRALNASSRGLALVLNRNLGVDAEKAIPWLQNPGMGHAQEGEDQIPRPPAEQKHGGRVGQQNGVARQRGGKVGHQPITPQGIGARKAKDGKWYVHDPNRPGKYLRVEMRK